MTNKKIKNKNLVLPKFLSKKILRGVSLFHEQSLSNEDQMPLPEEVNSLCEHLKENENYTKQDLNYILLLLSLPLVDQYFRDNKSIILNYTDKEISTIH